ncbi:MAG: hypothetical protein AzoDbin1_04112 [Azoarcus sp.]|nr:hypothetical protein [Azoarcus sp.]
MSGLLLRSSVADLAPLERVIDQAYPEAWREIAVNLYLQLRARRELAGDDAQAATLALELSEGLRAEIGGSQPYLSKGQRYKETLRDRRILAKFTGHNHDVLAREFDLTPRQIYAIVERRAREDFERRQGRLELDRVG